MRIDELTGIINTTKMMDTSVNPLSEEDKAIQIERVKNLIRNKYPNADLKKIIIWFSTKKPMDIVAIGPKGGETKIVLDDGSGLQSRFLNLTFVKNALGQAAEQIIAEDRNTAQEQHQRLVEAEKQLREAEKLAAESEKEAQEMQDLERKIERTQASVDAIQKQQGSHLESEAELRRLKQLKKIIKPNLQITNKNWPSLKNKQKTKKNYKKKLTEKRKSSPKLKEKKT